MGRLLLRDALLLDPESAAPARGSLLLEDGRIAARLGPEVPPPAGAALRELAGAALAPGFLDLHHHGAVIFAPPGEVGAALRHDAASLLRHGTTAFLPTTVALPGPQLAALVTQLARAAAELREADGATPLGIHLEGPWIQVEAAGAQPRDGIRPYEPREGEHLLSLGEGLVRMVTYAPEVEGAGALQVLLARRGVVGALGHSLCDASGADRVIDRGARHVTHLFNAMGELHHRSPGLAGKALADERLSCDLICDGVHVHPDAVRLAARAKGTGLMLITDRLDPRRPAAGLGSGALRDDGSAWRLPDGRLAGSRLTLDRALGRARDLGAMTLLEAVAACTSRPARLLGMESERGTLRVGARADLALLDAGGAVRETWIGGRPAWRAGEDGPPR